ncbi:uncharacterized protein BX664DRAFT_335112 [Halteromyces radiatus]|uniref:uncharacterized protein n=1 Tax=Halteromyces radiatus TaxID=101107 RepID=UPI002220C254|nr:uncharacterized protein BX664DRAFT_335112 [Halteromyces radiatus]KAI8086181.1 hypothetical protein BX664DRAFT_335112 [Halteromyces radiatus]
MSTSVASLASHPHRVSRKLTVCAETMEINVRPVVKGAIKEASHTLADAFNNDAVIEWCTRGIQSNDGLVTFFKSLVNSATLSSRDFAVQVEGCKGVMIWTNHPQGVSLPLSKLARMIGWVAALRSVMQYQPTRDKWRRKLMADYDNYLTIAYLGILPHEHRKGFGSALLKYVLDKADTSHYPVFVEVTEPGAVAFFEHHGFIIKGKGSFGELPVALMVREPMPTTDIPTPLRLKPGRRDSDNTI